MSHQYLAEDYISFLMKKGSISHIVKAPPGSSISTLALTQRCLASGIDFPVPLPDGSVAINIPGNVPAALAALDLVIESVQPPEEIAEAGETEGAEDVSVSYADDRPEEASQDDAAVSTHETFEAFNEDDIGEPSDDAEPDVTHQVEHDPDHLSGTSDLPEDGLSDEDADSTPAVFMRSSESQSVNEETPEVEARADDQVDDDTDVETWAEAPDEFEEREADRVEAQSDPMIADPEPADHLDEDTAPEEFAATDTDDAPEDAALSTDEPWLDESPSVTEDSDQQAREDRMDRILAMLTDLESRFGVLEDGQAGLFERFDSFSESLDQVAARPIPRPDTSEFNRGLARFSTVLAQTMRQLDTAVSRLTPETEEIGSKIAASLSASLTELIEAVRATQDGQSGTASDLAMISSMQETLSHQVAKLLEASHAQRVPVMEEFLLDVRHATAELLAEQARAAKAS